MTIPVVFAMGTETVSVGGIGVPVVKGTHWSAADPVVSLRPALFSADPRWGMQYTVEPDGYDAPIDDDDDGVESATNVPGERRSVRRGR